MITDHIGKLIGNNLPTLFLVGSDITQIDFCAEAMKAFNTQDCGRNEKWINMSSSFDSTIGKLPQQSVELFPATSFNEEHRFYFNLQDEVGNYGRWQITYTQSDTAVTANQIIEIQYQFNEKSGDDPGVVDDADIDLTINNPSSFDRAVTSAVLQ